MKTQKQIKKAPKKYAPLQLIKNAPPFTAEQEQYLQDVLHGDKWDIDEFLTKPASEKEHCRQMFELALNWLALDDKDRFIERIEQIIVPQTKSNIWDVNHSKILNALNSLTKRYGRVPSRSEIMVETGISRVTINKHLKNYHGSVEHSEKKEEYLLMRERVLATMYAAAIEGSVRAAKVFLSATDCFENPLVNIRNQQNNFIQVNGRTISQQQLNELPEDKQLQIQQLLSAIQQPA